MHINSDILILFIWTCISTLWVVIYVKDAIKGKTKPHSFTWFIWALIQSIAFGIQITHEGGVGSFIMFWYALNAAIIFFISLKYAQSTVSRSDYVFLWLALFAIALWLIFDAPLISVLLLILIDILAYIPTVRKSYHTPDEETLLLYFTGNIGLISSLLTLDLWSFVNYGYPLCITLLNFMFIWYVLLRRKILQK